MTPPVGVCPTCPTAEGVEHTHVGASWARTRTFGRLEHSVRLEQGDNAWGGTQYTVYGLQPRF